MFIRRVNIECVSSFEDEGNVFVSKDDINVNKLKLLFE
jgi:hypothetical protein